jgi:hypothetical protein
MLPYGCGIAPDCGPRSPDLGRTDVTERTGTVGACFSAMAHLLLSEAGTDPHRAWCPRPSCSLRLASAASAVGEWCVLRRQVYLRHGRVQVAQARRRLRRCPGGRAGCPASRFVPIECQGRARPARQRQRSIGRVWATSLGAAPDELFRTKTLLADGECHQHLLPLVGQADSTGQLDDLSRRRGGFLQPGLPRQVRCSRERVRGQVAKVNCELLEGSSHSRPRRRRTRTRLDVGAEGSLTGIRPERGIRGYPGSHRPLAP